MEFIFSEVPSRPKMPTRPHPFVPILQWQRVAQLEVEEGNVCAACGQHVHYRLHEGTGTISHAKNLTLHQAWIEWGAPNHQMPPQWQVKR